jgi:hypothetical protein
VFILGAFIGSFLLGHLFKKVNTEQELDLLDPLELLRERDSLLERSTLLEQRVLEKSQELIFTKEYIQLLDDAFDKDDTDFIYHELKTRNLKRKRLPDVTGVTGYEVCSGFRTWSSYPRSSMVNY